MFTRDPEPVALPPKPTSRRLLAAAGIVVIVSGFLIWRMTSTPDEPAAAPAAAPAYQAAAAPPSPPPVKPGQACAEFTDPPTTPGGTAPTWTTVGHVPAPSAPGVGPATTLPLRWCYAHTVAGALFAALNFVAQMETTDPTTLCNYLLADDQARAQVLAATTMSHTPPKPNTSPDVLQWIGYHLVSATPNAVTFDVLYRWAGVLNSTHYTVLWQQGDWKLAYPPELLFPLTVVPSADPTYWTLWGDPR